jgi:hypothetical protein
MEPKGQPNSRRNVAIGIFLLAFTLAIIAIVRVVGGDSSDSVDVLPSAELATGNNATLSTADLVGGPLVINFWYSA